MEKYGFKAGVYFGKGARELLNGKGYDTLPIQVPINS